MSKRYTEEDKTLAFMLYMQYTPQKEIMERVDIKSNRTMTDWIQKGGWKEKRAAKTITRTELINKTLLKISELLDTEGNDFNPDKLSKLAASIERLDKQASPIVIMDVFEGFGKSLQHRANTDKEITVDFIKKVNKYQDLYITEKLNS